MNGEICDLITTTTYGNRYLQTMVSPQISLGDSDGPFMHILSRSYIRKAGLLRRERVIATCLDRWLELEREQGACRFHLIYIPNSTGELPEHLASAFANGGGHWFVGAERDGRVYTWLSRRSFREGRNAEGGASAEPLERTGWEVQIKKWREVACADIPLSPSVDVCIERLRGVLHEAIEFTVAAEYENWTPLFKKSLRQLDGTHENNFMLANRIIPPNFLEKQPENLLMACMDAWLFGGMGSWNDSCPDDPKLRADPRSQERCRVGERRRRESNLYVT